MTLSLRQWHKRYQEQARWTKSIRDYLYGRINLNLAKRKLEVGCGTGVILDELNRLSGLRSYGLDINPATIYFAHASLPELSFSIGDALNLPFRSESFDICLCHFLFLWVKEPRQVMEEMTRIIRPGGHVLAIAEPDYGGRIDYPSELSKIGLWQIESLIEQGANPFIGRELRSLFYHAGLMDVEVGIIGGQWTASHTEENTELEWEVIQSDLQNNNEFQQSAALLKSLDQTARKSYQRILFVPTFYAIGVKKV